MIEITDLNRSAPLVTLDPWNYPLKMLVAVTSKQSSNVVTSVGVGIVGNSSSTVVRNGLGAVL